MAATCRLQAKPVLHNHNAVERQGASGSQELAGVRSSEVLRGPQMRCIAVEASGRQHLSQETGWVVQASEEI